MTVSNHVFNNKEKVIGRVVELHIRRLCAESTYSSGTVAIAESHMETPPHCVCNIVIQFASIKDDFAKQFSKSSNAWKEAGNQLIMRWAENMLVHYRWLGDWHLSLHRWWMMHNTCLYQLMNSLRIQWLCHFAITFGKAEMWFQDILGFGPSTG